MKNYIIELIYFILTVGTTIVIINDTRNPIKSLAYILLVVFLPVIGAFVYFSVGINYRKRRFYRNQKIQNQAFYSKIQEQVEQYSRSELEKNKACFENHEKIVRMLSTGNISPPFSTTNLELLLNGEEKFPKVLEALDAAKEHIHIEYFIYNDDEIGNLLKDKMIRKAKEGVAVRFIFDDYGSRVVRKRMLKELRESGVETYPFYKIRFLALANGMNFRNHRKIIVIDGKVGFIGGINVDDRYINSGKNKLFWRDTHLKIEGNAVAGLQRLFLSDWNSCKKRDKKTDIQPDLRYFPISDTEKFENPVQIVGSGPDSSNADIMLSILGIIAGSRKRLFITTPYFIPNETIVDALKFSALSGVDVRLLVPGISDSTFVNAASCSYYEELLSSGVRIYRYQKGFVHAKTIVSDDTLSVIGTANMDIRSFDIMFEVNALIYSKSLNEELGNAFFHDIENSSEINGYAWSQRNRMKKFGEKCARLLSPLL